MRSTTHIAFGAGASSLAAGLLSCSMPCWLLAVMASAALNLLIDAIGHDHRLLGGTRRTRATHSLPGLAILTLAAWLLSRRGVVLAPGEAGMPLLASIAAGAFSHWLLDSLTPGGVYLVRRRFRLARVGYANPLANAFFTLLGLALLGAGALIAAGLLG